MHGCRLGPAASARESRAWNVRGGDARHEARWRSDIWGQGWIRVSKVSIGARGGLQIASARAVELGLQDRSLECEGADPGGDRGARVGAPPDRRSPEPLGRASVGVGVLICVLGVRLVAR